MSPLASDAPNTFQFASRTVACGSPAPNASARPAGVTSVRRPWRSRSSSAITARAAAGIRSSIAAAARPSPSSSGETAGFRRWVDSASSIWRAEA